ncbi:MAG: glutamine-hydrolyzing GMP synthase [Bacteroidetes bacterium RIFCSPLOWO2_02_FULL_36_8]|nr:MAG: glutamine-hydrolyzing GMP synthase [Bacteroidetes bacterium RIFCSPLOWO2_02_FULL_36_8]OFY69631.1 MAG: glutamine-hydrolyzing GMP synthase [Bacteroidetes bacterium RIFCSPLOWO2_12_FULL_37_12]
MEKILIIDFGSQYTQLIARRIRELNVYCEIHPFHKNPKPDIFTKGIILSGSPFSVNARRAPVCNTNKLRKKIPLLGVCYGAQLLAKQNGGNVATSAKREYGRAELKIKEKICPLFKDIHEDTQVWMSHGDSILKLPENSKCIAETPSVKNAAFQYNNELTFGIQFHPEVTHTIEGKTLLKNFVLDICKCSQDWTPKQFITSTIESIKQTVTNEKVVLGLSGGVDSTVAAVLLDKAIGKNLQCIFVDNGLLRKNEFESVCNTYREMNLNVLGIKAEKRFLSALKGISEPEQKRKIIGKTFIEVFEKNAKKIKNVKWLAQGTIYPDVIESVSVYGPSATIKSHHNVGGLPERMNLQLLEPLNRLFKDEVRRVGVALNIKDKILQRHPFPGPGLAVRILGEVTNERIRILQESDDIFISGLNERNLYNEVWQAGAVFLPVRSVGVMGDERTYENVICLRAVNSEDGMTADWCKLPYDFLGEISNKIINQVKGINRVVYDISSKPPATIEWE